MVERFTDRAQKVMAFANGEAQRFNHEYIGTEHILLGLVKEGQGVGAAILKNLTVELNKVRLEVEKLLKSGPDMVSMGKLLQTPRAKKVIEFAIEEARNLNHNYIGTEHLVLGLLREHDGVAAQVLMNFGLNLEQVRTEIKIQLEKPVDCSDVTTEQTNDQRSTTVTNTEPQSKVTKYRIYTIIVDGNYNLLVVRRKEQVELIKIPRDVLEINAESSYSRYFNKMLVITDSGGYRVPTIKVVHESDVEEVGPDTQ
ncbi:MAG: clpC [Candidatus Paceibacter sp.]|jgi:ATP-dependent Clp protease ATP-binding subunit ClpA|nr:clpC [Candidatus Paceibacter sp.]